MRIGIPGYDRNGQSTQTHSQIWKIRSQDCQKTRAGLEAIRISSGSGLKGADIPRGRAPCGAWNGLGDYSAAGGFKSGRPACRHGPMENGGEVYWILIWGVALGP